MYVFIELDYYNGDEHSVPSFAVMTKEKMDEAISKTRKYFGGKKWVEVYFGSNQFVLFENYDDWHNALKIKEITEEEYLFFKKFFYCSYYKTIRFGILDQFMELYKD